MSGGMISRVADHCFWFGRYLERAESTARVLQATRKLALDTELSPSECWRPTIVVAGEEAAFKKLFGEDAASDGERVEEYMVWNEDNLSSLHHSVRAARDNARSIREVLSLEAFEVVNELHVWAKSDAARAEYDAHRYGFYRRVGQSGQLCLGLLRSTMLHDTPLDFIWLAVMLERAGQIARLLDVHHRDDGTAATLHPVVEMDVWLTLLDACSGLEPFMQRHRGRVSPASAAAFLVLESKFPRSLRYCVHAAYEKLCRIRPPEDGSLPGAESVAVLGHLDRWLAESTATSIEPALMHDLLTRVVNEIAASCEAIGRDFLGYPPLTPSEPAQSQTQGAA